MTARVFGYLTEKGGAGKTTTSLTFSHWLALQFPGKKVAHLDTCNALHSMNWKKARQRSGYPEQFFVDFMTTPSMIAARVEELLATYDYVVVDGKPDIDVTMQNTAQVCDVVVVPLKPGIQDLNSAIATASYLLGMANPTHRKTVFLRTAWESRTTNGQNMLSALDMANAGVQLPIVPTIIEDRTAWTAAMSVGSTVFEFDPKSTAAAEAHAAFTQIMEIAS